MFDCLGRTPLPCYRKLIECFCCAIGDQTVLQQVQWGRAQGCLYGVFGSVWKDPICPVRTMSTSKPFETCGIGVQFKCNGGHKPIPREESATIVVSQKGVPECKI